MLKRKQTRANQVIYKFCRQLWRLLQKATLGLTQWLTRTLLIVGRKQRRPANARAGFVLPTVTLLLLVVSLVIGAILFRTGNRTNQVIGAREEQVIYNAATPAIERAKAKLEYLFLKDKRFPSGPPSDEMLLSMITNRPDQYGNLTYRLDENPYKFERETEINVGDGNTDPAWSFQMDVDGDNQNETVVYSIAFKTRQGSNSITSPNYNAQQRARDQVVRNGPLTTTNVTNAVCRDIAGGSGTPATIGGPPRAVNDADWTQVGSAKLRKTFQVNAIVLSRQNGVNRTVATLEFQQDRQLDRGNKWGAWFRNDLEIFPGSKFRWNGAMYTAGNLIVGDPNFEAYLISARNSCFYTRDSSEIKVNRDIQTPATPENPSFQGQFVSGKMGNDQPAGDSLFHVMQDDDSPDITANNIKLDKKTDSVRGENDYTPSQIALDPVLVFTRDQSQARVDPRDNINKTAPGFYTDNAGAGEIGYFNAKKRLMSSAETAPFVDDSYRADDRYGPKPYYDRKGNEIRLNNSNKKNGVNIEAGDKPRLTNTTLDPLDTEFRNVGLDGYWERRAHVSGLRVVVGERLELGNPFGWVNSPLKDNTGADIGGANRDDVREFDPLYPVDLTLPNPPNLRNADRQRRTLRDNLAAVQGTVVYQATPGVPPTAPTRPIACTATTAHPGTRQTISNSKNFSLAKTTYGNLPGNFYSDFFTGLGTNGWEYTPPPAAASLRSGEWEKALKNLANFAGDWQDASNNGAFPPTQGSRIFPHPYLTMWGNFSNLNRAIYEYNSSNSSIADNSYLESAACTLGMLAYNVQYFSSGTDYSQAGGTPATLAEELSKLLKFIALGANPSVSDTANGRDGIVVNRNTLGSARRATVYINGNSVKTVTDISQLTPDDYIGVLESKLGGSTNSEVKLAKFIAMREQIARDRQSGFLSSPFPALPNPTATVPTPDRNTDFDPDIDSLSPNNDPSLANDGNEIALACRKNNNTFSNVNISSGSNNALRLLCPSQPKFPALYYVFPLNAHDRVNPSGGDPRPQPTNEPYTNPTLSPALPAPRGDFQVVTLSTLANDVKPKNEGSWSGCNDTAWCLPSEDGGPAPLIGDFEVTTPSGGKRRLSLIDNALYNGRELMTVRALDIDLEQLRTKNSPTGDTWLPRSGIVYAFREDAVREDAISRPSGGGSCNNYTAIRGDNCLIRADINNPRDPVNADNGISPKAVDFFPDPDRRPHGFRLRNGRRLDRGDDNSRGLTFVSDNPVYIQGDFNFHSTDGNSNNLEEFTNELDDNWGDFYDRDVLNPNFSKAATDKWRPAEILADAITILSDNFQEGSIDRGILDDTDGGPDRTGISGGRYSFRAMNGPSSPGGLKWVLENGTVIEGNTRTTDPGSGNPFVRFPIKISRNGSPIVCNTSPAVGSVCPVNEQREIPLGEFRQPGVPSYVGSINEASQTRVNASLISGIVPSRVNQSYGGFHNFPRFIENWQGTTPLRISGSFLQLNFSSYATAPFELNQWEPNSSDTNDFVSGLTPIEYYRAPARLWGYDVGLQYAPAGPAAQRFLQPPAQRSEFYRELPADDAYICQLRRVSGVDPNATRECAQ